MSVAAEADAGLFVPRPGQCVLPSATSTMSRLLGRLREIFLALCGVGRTSRLQRLDAAGAASDALNQVPVGILLADSRQSIVRANAAFVRLFDESAGAIVRGRSLPACITSALSDQDGEMRLPGGRWVKLSRDATPDGGFVLTASDISTLKQREANRGAFLANISHELRTPLSAIIGFSELIAAEKFGPVQEPRYRDFASDILQSARHLLELVNDILDIAKLQSEAPGLRPQSIVSRMVVDEAVRIIRKQAEEAGIQLELCVPGTLPMIYADRVRLRQVLLNLLSNAIKFTPKGGTVWLTVTPALEGLRILVRDTGIGIPASELPRVLEPFVQAHSKLAKRPEGFGLGLPITKLLVERHGGSLTIDSHPDVGTTVTVLWPATPADTTPLSIAS